MNRFDRILWRINGIAFLLILVSGLIPVSVMLFSMLPWSSQQHKESAIVNIDQSTHEKEYFNLGHADLFKGTSTVRMPLDTEESYRGSFSTSPIGSVRNYLFLDYSDMTSHWLFSGFHRIIPACHDLYVPLDCNGGDRNVVGSIYEVITLDSNHDGKATADDRISAVFSTVDGKSLSEIVAPTERIITVEQVSDSEVLIIYSSQKSAVGAIFSVKNGKKIRDANLPLNDQ